MSNQEYARVVGRRIKRIREGKGMTRLELAEAVGVDHTALSCWEMGKYMPRDGKRVPLSRALGLEVHELFAHRDDDDEVPASASPLSNDSQMATALNSLVRGSRHLRMLRFAYPYSTAARSKIEFRQYAEERILSDSLEVNRAEVFYDLGRLKEVLSNIFRFNGRAYWVKGFVGGPDVLPSMDIYIGDKDTVVLSAYWNSVPSDDRPRMQVSGAVSNGFFRAYWNEVWNRGRLLNIRGSQDISAVRDIALKLGLRSSEWPEFVEQARHLEMEDGAVPLP